MLFSILEHIGRVSRRILVSNVSEGALSNVAEGYDGVRCRSVDVEVAVDGGGKERFHSNVNARNGRAGGGGIVRSLLLLLLLRLCCRLFKVDGSERVVRWLATFTTVSTQHRAKMPFYSNTIISDRLDR